MRDKRKTVFAWLCIFASFFLFLCFFCSPADLGRFIGFNGTIDSLIDSHIKTFRIGSLLTGLMLSLWGIAYLRKPHLLDSVDNWVQSWPSGTKNIVAVSILLALACASYLPFTYHGVFGERDSYRMLCGILDSLNTGTPFANSTLYARHHSIGYYAWFYLFSDVIRENPHSAFTLFNYTNAIAAILMVIPLFVVVRRFWGLGAAIIANLVLMITPVWWQMSRYGHPQLIAVFFNFVGLAILCYRSRIAKNALAKVKTAAADICIIIALALSLMNRLDCILMFPLILAILVCERQPIKASILSLAAYTLLPVLIYFIFDSALPAADTASSSSMGDTLKLIWRWHNPTTMIENFWSANQIFVSGYPGFLLFAFIVACLYLIRMREYTSLFFLLPVVLINYIFWLPNPFPARHFMYFAPLISIGIAILLTVIGRKATSLFSNNKLSALAGVFFVFLIGYLSTSLIDDVPIYRNMYSPEKAISAGRYGKDLMKIPQMDHPIFVVSDAIPVVVNMQLISDSIKIKKDHQLLFVNNRINDFVFTIKGWKQERVSALRDKAEKHEKAQWLLDPYNDYIYSKIKNINPVSPQPQPRHIRSNTEN